MSKMKKKKMTISSARITVTGMLIGHWWDCKMVQTFWKIDGRIRQREEGVEGKEE